MKRSVSIFLRRRLALAGLVAFAVGLAVPLALPELAWAQEPARPRTIILVAGKKSHGPVGNGTHDYGWSVRLLKVMLERSNIKEQVRVETYFEEGPGDLRVYDKADAIMIISDGRDGNQYAEAPHLASDERVRYFDGLMKRGCGCLTFHFSTFTPDKYAEQIYDWTGGYFKWEQDGKRQWYSGIKTLDTEVRPGTPDHPVCRGIRPFKMREEFYYNIRFKPDDAALKPILVVPALQGREPDGNVVAWARERAGGGRGFGTTCGHYYDNWKNDAFRKLMLNAIAWAAKVEVPKDGVEAKFHTHEEINGLLGPYPGTKPAP